MDLNLLNENLKNVTNLTYNGEALSEDNKIKLLPTVVQVDEYKFEIASGGIVNDKNENTGSTSGEGDKEITRKEIEAAIENAKKEAIEQAEEKINDTKNNIEQTIIDTKNNIEETINNTKNSIEQKIYPVGSIYISTNSTDPSEIFGGTWERYGKGRTLVSLDENQEEFKSIGQTGGEKVHTLTIAEMPRHDHDTGASTDGYWLYGGRMGELAGYSSGLNQAWARYSTSIAPQGSSQPHNNLQPYIVTYMWKRIS